MKFQLIVCGLFNFLHTYDSANFSIGTILHEKMLLATALALLITGCLTDVYFNSKQTGSSSTKGNHHPSFLRFWNWAEETVDAAKICGGAENVVKTETQQTFVNGLPGFYYFLVFILRWKCIAHNNCMSCPSIWATLSALLINILLGSFQLFLHSDQPL